MRLMMGVQTATSNSACLDTTMAFTRYWISTNYTDSLINKQLVYKRK
jgi:hypothetical protein